MLISAGPWSRWRALLCLSTLTACLALAAPAPGARANAAGAPATPIPPSVARAAARHAVQASGRALASCLHTHPHQCGAARRALQSARVRNRLVRTVYFQSAPVIAVAGHTLSWRQIGDNWYVFVRKVAGQPDRYSVIQGNVITPPAVPGAIVKYSVRAYYSNNWAPEVSIGYPASPTPPPVVPPPVLSGGPGTGGGVIGSAGSSAGGGSGGAGGSGGSGGPGGSGEPGGSGGPGGSGEPGGSGGPGGGAGGETFGLPFAKGVNANFAGWGSQVPQLASEMSSMGMKWEREDLAWSEVEPAPGVFHWSGFEAVIAAAKANGVTLLPIVGYAPAWTSPTNAAAYAEFVAAAVARFGPGTSANLQWWELWNEPYFAYAWSNHTPEPEAYARDALAAAKAAKAVSPSVKLLVSADYQNAPQTGGSSTTQTSWIDDMFTAAPALGQWVDGVSVHPYGDDPSTPLAQPGTWKDAAGQWAFQRIDTIRAKFRAHGVNVPFWITEEGWSTWNLSEASIAKNYADLIVQIKARPWVRGLFAFCLREFNPNPTNNQPGFGLLKYGSWQPKGGVLQLQEGLKALS